MMLRSRRKAILGFALIEILVAITIVGLAVPALMVRMQSISNTTVFIENKTVAYWIAENKMQELIIDHSLLRNAANIRVESDTLEYDGREWFWEIKSEPVPLPPIFAPAKMFRVEIEVGLEENNRDRKGLANLSGFVSE